VDLRRDCFEYTIQGPIFFCQETSTFGTANEEFHSYDILSLTRWYKHQTFWQPRGGSRLGTTFFEETANHTSVIGHSKYFDKCSNLISFELTKTSSSDELTTVAGFGALFKLKSEVGANETRSGKTDWDWASFPP
jgi:hypothetical protein